MKLAHPLDRGKCPVSKLPCHLDVLSVLFEPSSCFAGEGESKTAKMQQRYAIYVHVCKCIYQNIMLYMFCMLLVKTTI